MRILLLLLLFYHLTVLISCTNSSNSKDNWEPSYAKQGDCFVFKDSLNKYFLGTVMSIHKSTDGIWYAMCFNDYYDSTMANDVSCDSLRFCGRKVMYYTPDQYTIGLDITWVPDTVIDLNKQRLLCKIDLEPLHNIGFSGEGYANSFREFFYHFYLTRNNRQSPPDDYWDLFKERFRADEYFTLEQITDWYKNFNRINY